MSADLIPFVPFPKIPRLARECVITEKIDGTNASVLIDEEGSVIAGSRTRWITPADDNFGFAAWVAAHEEELRALLGPGHHFGEWYGAKIQRGYGLDHRRFALFNTARWGTSATGRVVVIDDKTYFPFSACGGHLEVVPILYQGPFSQDAVEQTLLRLQVEGSDAAPGFMRPEGVVVYHTAARQYFKRTIEKDEEPKARRAA